MESSYPPLTSRHGYRREEESPFSSHGDKSSKLEAENEYLKERIKSCEKGLSGLYQLLVPRKSEEDTLPPPRVLSHHRSASLTYQSRSGSNSTSSPIPDPHTRRASESVGRKEQEDTLGHVVTFPEIREVLQSILSEREQLLCALEDNRQITEAAKRERVMAIDEKDQLLREAHDLKVALDKITSALKEVELERKELANQIRDLERDANVLRRANEEAMRMRNLAIEERSKIIDDFSELQNEVTTLQNERSELLDETLQLQSAVSKLTNEKRKLLQELDWSTKRSTGYEAVARSLKEQNEILNGTSGDSVYVRLSRSTPGQPWGFSIEGGRGAEYYHDDPSIVVSGISDNTPAYGLLSIGDRLLSLGGKNLRNALRKEAAEIIRSCDQLVIDVEVARVTTHIKPLPKEVKIPGKKTFGFTYESRLFVSSVDPQSPAVDILLPGDEILQVIGKSAINMKPSIFKQFLKNCKNGVTMTIQRPLSTVTKGNGKSRSSSKFHRNSSDSSFSRNSVLSQKRSSNEFSQHLSYQAPGTPGSSVSETSAGYHSLTHSMPSILSTTLSPIDPRTSQSGLEPAQPDSRALSQLATYQEESEPSDEETNGMRYRKGSSTSIGLTRQRPTHVYTPRRNTTSGTGFTSTSRSQPTFRSRTTSQSSYGGAPHHPPLTPGNETTPPFTRLTYKGSSLPRGLYPPDYAASYRQARRQVISMSADNLDSDSFTGPLPPTSFPARVSRTMSHGCQMTRASSHDIPQSGHVTRTSLHDVSHDSHMIPVKQSRHPISMSMSSMQTHV